MPNRRLAAALLAVAAVAITSGCTTIDHRYLAWNDRFYVPGRDPLLSLMGAEFERPRDWPAAELPYIRPMRTELIPDRLPPKADPPLGWPPL
ncbi:MAG: hypothetical protein OEX23_11875 [Betaproteobacteria bacterium]|jgi:hypothetical protein|nr:hypothetical protein [Betaproteobacteria bacterium]